MEGASVFMSRFQPIFIEEFLPTGKVYVARLWDSNQPVFCEKRKDAIEKCKNELHKKQKYCVWKLLEYALARQGFDVPVVDFSFEGGKWIASGIRFSLSHSYDYVAVAISDYPIGIDIQKYVGSDERVAKRVLSKIKYCEYLSAVDRDEFFIKEWTKIEAKFKCGEGGECKTETVDDYALSVCVDLTERK